MKATIADMIVLATALTMAIFTTSEETAFSSSLIDRS